MAQARQKARKGEAAQNGREGHRKPHALEWAIGGVSALLVLAMSGFILYRALTTTGGEPDLRVAAQEVHAAGEGFRVGFIAFNRGGGTAAGVTIEGRLEDDGEIVETSRVTIDYVPAQSEQRGGLFFSRDPRQHRLRIEAAGYTRP